MLGIKISKVVVVYIGVSRDLYKCNIHVHVTECVKVFIDSSKHTDVAIYGTCCLLTTRSIAVLPS